MLIPKYKLGLGGGGGILHLYYNLNIQDKFFLHSLEMRNSRLSSLVASPLTKFILYINELCHGYSDCTIAVVISPPISHTALM